MQPSISVIVPVYKVENLVERCVRSLMEQTLEQGVEYVFVDDATPDKSFDIVAQTLRDYPLRLSQTKFLRHEHNKGLPAARNTGLDAATGEYILHFDADDFAEKDLLEKMRDKAIETGADYIWADWFLDYERSVRLMKQSSYSTPEQTLRALLTGRIKYNVWNKIVRRTLYSKNDIRFPEGHNMGEDMTMIRLAACASTVAHVDYAGYHYVKTNSNAMTAALSAQSLCDIEYNVAETLAFVKTKINAAQPVRSTFSSAQVTGSSVQVTGPTANTAHLSANVTHLPANVKSLSMKSAEPLALDLDCEKLAAAFCLNTKFPLLMSSASENYKRWASLWPQCNRYIRKSGFSLRNTALNFIASWGWWPLVRLHYYLYSLFYNSLYK